MLACLYDVHGNLPALEAVLADAARQRVTRRLLGGDYALTHPDGAVEHRRVEDDHAAAVQRVREAFGDAPWVRTTAARLAQARFDAV